MRKINSLISRFLLMFLALLLSFTILVTQAHAQLIQDPKDQAIAFDKMDAQKLLQAATESPILKQEIELLKQQLELAEREKQLLEDKITLEQERTKIAEEKAQAYADALKTTQELVNQYKQFAELQAVAAQKARMWGTITGIAGLALAAIVAIAAL